MRTSVPISQRSRPDALTAVTLYQEYPVLRPSLFQRGLRQLTAFFYNDQPLTLNLYHRIPASSSTWRLVSTTALAATSSSVNNQEKFDLTGLSGAIMVEIVGGATPCSQYFCALEANDSVEAGGCSS